MSSLTNLFISASYKGLLHSSGAPVPSSGKTTIYDGNGGTTALALGLTGNGATITGPTTITGNATVSGNTTMASVTITGSLNVAGFTKVEDNFQVTGALTVNGASTIGGLATVGDLKVGNISFPTTGSDNQILIMNGTTSASFTTQITNDNLPNSGVVAATYTNPSEIKVNSKGIVTSVTSASSPADDTVTSTRFVTPVTMGDKVIFQLNEFDEWKSVDMINTFKSAKGGIFILNPEMDNDDKVFRGGHYERIYVSYDGGDTEMLIYTIRGGNDQEILTTTPFHTLLGGGANSRSLRFKRTTSDTAETKLGSKLTFRVIGLATLN